MNGIRRGYAIEKRMMRQFKGRKTSWDEVDFETGRALYEVKSSQLFRQTVNHQEKRPYRGFNQGRFHILTGNHILLYLRSLQTLKPARYLFVLRFGNQCLYRVVRWEDIRITNDRDYHEIPISRFFTEGTDAEA